MNVLVAVPPGTIVRYMETASIEQPVIMDLDALPHSVAITPPGITAIPVYDAEPYERFEPGWPSDMPLHEAVGQALGAASMCWHPRPSSQVFDSVIAEQILDALMGFIHNKQIGLVP